MIDIKIPNFNHVKQQIESYKRNLGMKVNELLERLAEIGITEATFHFNNAEYDGDNDVVVDTAPEWIDDNTIAVNASGQSILFIEFGTGVYNPVEHPKADEMGMIRGEYGSKHGRNYTWYYHGNPGTNGELLKGDRVRTHGNNANRCMWDAAEAMRDQIYDIVKEIFYD